MNFSIIIPCYNEVGKLTNTLNKLQKFMNNLSDYSYEIIIVNDGSTNCNSKDFQDVISKSKLTKSSQRKATNFISYSVNKGKGYAVKQGIKVSKGDWVLFMDCDLATDLSAIHNVIRYQKDYDVIIGSRKITGTRLVKSQGKIRTFVGIMCHLITNIIVPLPNIKDTQCGFKAFDGNFARAMIEKQRVNRFAFDVEYLYMAQLNKKKIKEIPIIWKNDEDSKVSVVSSSINFFKCLFVIRMNKTHYIFKD